MKTLKECFITTERPYQEGTVEVFEQTVPAARRATLSITALGVYEARINGKKVGDRFLAPGYTYYPLNLHTQTYNVTGLLTKPDNTLRVALGQGWYCGRFTCENKTQIYGERPAVSWILTVETGSETRVFTSADSTVQAVESPWRSASLYDGEEYCADGAGLPVLPPVPFTGNIPETLEPCDTCVKVQEEMPVQSVTRCGDRVILDFGQNFAGIIEIDPTKMKGGTLTVRHGERLNGDSSLYTNNLRTAKATITYHKGSSNEKYRPAFTYMGFRYVELTGCDYLPGLVTAYAVHTDMERTGWFASDNKKVERLYLNQLWGQRSNYVEVPTDCPQRDERQGYTGDGQVYARTGMYNYDTEAFWRKFLKDIRYSQRENTEGYVAPTIPAQGPAGVGFINMLGWANCDTIVPEQLYWQYGDDTPLKEQYDSMKTLVECEIRHMGEQNLWLGPNLGDWLAPGRDIRFMAMHNGPVSNSFIVNDLRIMVWAARHLNRTEDEARYADQLQKTRAAYEKAFVNDDGTMTDDYQGAYVMALAYVLEPGALWDSVFEKLVEKLRAEGIDTGFFATAQLLPLLADHGQEKLAFDLLLQENCPGWMYQVDRDATTIWERWDAVRPDGTVNEEDQNGSNMVSFNHYAFGAVGEFYYRYILGIQPAEPGFAKARIRPLVDERLGGVRGRYNSRAGQFLVDWCIKDHTAAISIQTPVPAQVILPDGTEHSVPAGQYAYSCPLEK